MSDNSTIEWTDATWNPVTGCARVSAGCDHCYAVRGSYRLEKMGQEKYAGLTVLNGRGDRHFNGTVRCHEEALDRPERWTRPRMIFVNSMSDLFHRDVPKTFIQKVFDVMAGHPQHTFQVLTKRPERAASVAADLDWTKNIWLGTSVEDSSVVERVRILQKIPAKVRFLSVEPLLGPIPRLPLRNIHWVIAGGESGSAARPMSIDWVRQIRDRCADRGVPFFFKQWGGVNKKARGRVLDGRIWDELPMQSAGVAT